MSQLRLHVDGQTFRDSLNREIILRGINVAGDAKYPQTPDLRSHNPQQFFDADVSFVGKPFSLEDADTHFRRLRQWGYNTIRYIFTWEAIEHAGPKIYDEEWIDFTIGVLRVAKKYQFYIFMDPHQDVTGTEVIDPKGELAWLSAEYDDSYHGWSRDPGWKLGECLWAQHGVWDSSKGQEILLQKDYFSRNPLTGEKLDYEGFTNSYFLDHYRAYKDAIRSVCGSTIMFCQPPVMELPPSSKGTADDDPNMVHAVHFYDGLTLLTKHWNRLYNVDVIGVLRGKYFSPVFAMKIGERSIRRCLRHQLKFLRDESLQRMGVHPLIFTEIGIPYDMDNKYAYKTGDYRSQIRAMDANHFALEGSKSNGFALWGYMAAHDHEWGDQWNGEDLSIFSPNDLEAPIRAFTDPTRRGSTGRPRDHLIDTEDETSESLKALTPPSTSSNLSRATLQPQQVHRAAEAYLRPTPIYINGRLKSYGFNLKKCTFTMRLIANQTTPSAPSEIYLPGFHFPIGETSVMASGGKWEIYILEFHTVKLQYLRWWHGEGKADIKIRRKKRTGGEYAALQKLHKTRCMMM
ncbi:Glycoside hydrolase superfamily [Penicillium coprophilum]|uniref:Glycoside hydrolase superfamily n=1 Tax=Penicillium coprophilum TaxID=36646 RepID=UPI0023A1D45E|nr:Glycoside hydrolase superfamily [Penicillium coprophilum]KAJ5170115.1 Glycoside hydrolase superfamily [Penicillium coprophilum]